ncbi:unnamed protein product, partial [Symbiodinium necroappetens]
AIREILLASDTNRLVAELTFVRINDLAAPPENVNFLMYLEPFVGFLILANGILIGLQTDPTFEDWPHWVYVEMVFNFFLVLEVMLRLCSLNRLLGSCFQSSNSRAYGAAHQDCSRVLCAIGYPVVDMAEMD